MKAEGVGTMDAEIKVMSFKVGGKGYKPRNKGSL